LTEIYAFDEYELDASSLELTRAGRYAKANQLSLRLLAVLVRKLGQLVTKQELLDEVWDGRVVSDNVITVAMTRLRRTLGYEPGKRDLVVNVHGRGYRFARRVVARTPHAPAVPAAPTPAEAQPAPFVGRDSVLTHLRAALHDADAGSGGVVLLTGEPGIGKTRAAEVFSREVRARGLPVAWGHCREAGDTPPLWPFAELVRDLAAQQRFDAADPRWLALQPRLRRLLPELHDATRAAGPDEADAGSGKLSHKHRIFDAITRTLTLAAEGGACLLVLDDLHRADPASLELLEYFVDAIARTRILLVAGLRPNTGARVDTASRVLGHRNATRIELPRLGEAHVGAYLDAVLGGAGSSLRRSVFAHSEGNPFFMVELARQLRLSESADPARLRLPDAALDVLRQRVALLDERARSVLAAAAVIGRTFSLPVLQSVTGLAVENLMVSLDRALAGELISPKPDSLTEFVFGHELLRAVLYDTLAPGERRLHHLRVAQALEQRLEKGDGVPPSDLAYHSRSALPSGDLRKTIRYCMDAATAAAHVYAFGDAARHMQHALETLDMLESPSAKLRISLLHHQALFIRAHCTRDFQPLIARVVQLAQEHKQSDILARAAMLHDPYPGLLPLPGSVEAFRAALALLPADAPLRAATLARLAASAPLAFDAAQSARQLELAEELAERSNEVLDRYSVRVGRLFLSGGPDDPARTQELLHELDQLYREQGAMLSMPRIMLELHRALAALQSGELAAMHAALEHGELLCRQFDSELLWHFERFALLRQVNTGAGGEVQERLMALHTRARTEAITGTALFHAHDAVLIYGLSVDQPRELREALAPADNDRPNLWALKLRVQQAAGWSADARAALHKVRPERLAALPHDRDYLGTLGSLMRAAIGLGEPDYVRALYPLLERYTDLFCANSSFLCEGSVSQVLGAAAQALGQSEQAAALLKAGTLACARAGLMRSEQEAKHELARLSRERRREPERAEHSSFHASTASKRS